MAGVGDGGRAEEEPAEVVGLWHSTWVESEGPGVEIPVVLMSRPPLPAMQPTHKQNRGLVDAEQAQWILYHHGDRQ